MSDPKLYLNGRFGIAPFRFKDEGRGMAKIVDNLLVTLLTAYSQG